MNTFFAFVVILQVLSALAIVGLVLVQHGKGADMGAAFGSGASGSLFGATGSSNFFSKATGVAAAVFFSSTLALSYHATNKPASISGGVMDSASTPATTFVPAAKPASAKASAPMAAPASASAVSASAPVAAASAASAVAASAASAASAGQSNQIPK